jgi:hypothetical protein
MTRLTSSADGRASFVCGRFEARFTECEHAKAAARDARASGFVVDLSQESAKVWLIIGRRREAFPLDEQHRYASRVEVIATRNGGVFTRFVEESSETI